jgi:MFS transporter, DHA1 family, tetracycline resistance protein
LTGALGQPALSGPQGFRRGVLLPSLFLLVAMLNLTLIVAGLRELVIDELGGTARDAGLFFSIEMAAYIVFAPLWGLLSDRLGRRRPFVIVGFLLSAALYAAYSMVDSVTLLLGLRFVQGAASVMAWSTLMAMVVDAAEGARRGRWLGLMGGALMLGVSLGAPLGGYVSRHLGARGPLEVAAGLFLLIGLGSLALREPASLRRQTALREVLGTLRSRPRLLVPYAFYFVDRYTVGILVVLLPLYLGSLGADPALRGRYLAVFLLPFALLQYLTGRASERTGPYAPLLLGSLLYGLALCFVGVSGLHGLWYVMAALGVLAAIMFPPTLVLTAELSEPATRGSAMGGFNLAGSVGFAVGPVAGIAIGERYGTGAAFISAGSLEVLAVTVAAAFLLAARRRRNLAPEFRSSAGGQA